MSKIMTENRRDIGIGKMSAGHEHGCPGIHSGVAGLGLKEDIAKISI